MNTDLNNLMKEAQKMQQRMQKTQEQLSQLEIMGEAGGGMVKATINGRHEVLAMKINPSLIEDGEVEMLQDLIAAAINDAVRKVEKTSKEMIGQLTAGLNIPTDFLKKDEDKE